MLETAGTILLYYIHNEDLHIMSHLGNTEILERHFEDALELNRLELIAELKMGIFEASYWSFDDLADLVANKRFEEGPDGPC